MAASAGYHSAAGETDTVTTARFNRYRGATLFPHLPVMAGTWCAFACTFPGHLRGEYPRCFYFSTFSLDLVLVLDVFAWVGGVLWSWSFLTSAARRVGEVRKRKRNGQDSTRPGQRRSRCHAGRTVPACMGAALMGGCAGAVGRLSSGPGGFRVGDEAARSIPMWYQICRWRPLGDVVPCGLFWCRLPGLCLLIDARGGQFQRSFPGFR